MSRWMRTISARRTATMSQTEMTDFFVWSLWQRRLYPYEALSTGDEVWTVEKHSGRRHIGWRTDVRKVVALPYRSLADAADIVEDVFGLPQAEFLDHDYTLGKRDDTGILLAARLEAVAVVDRTLPSAIVLDQMGWTSLDYLDDDELKKLGLA